MLMHKLKQFIAAYKENTAVRFLLTAVFLYFIWELNYNLWIEKSGFSYWLCSILGQSGAKLLSVLGYNSTWVFPSIYLNNLKAINIGVPCNGLEFMGLFLCFVLAFPAKIKSKVWFLPLGIFLIHLLNMFRVLFLVLNFYFYRSTFDFNHHITFTVVVYGLILLMCFLWARKQKLFIHVHP